MIKRKFIITEQAGTPVASPATVFTSTTHHTTNAQALEANAAGAVGLPEPANIKSTITKCDVYLTFSSTSGQTNYAVQVSSDGTNYATKASGNVTTNSSVIVEDVEGLYILVGVSPNAAGAAANVLCTVSGVREIYRNEMIERS